MKNEKWSNKEKKIQNKQQKLFIIRIFTQKLLLVELNINMFYG